MAKSAALIVLFGILISDLPAQEKERNYRVLFGNDYVRAVDFLNRETWIDSLARTYGLNSKLMKAVVFPELIRYNSIQDKIETFALETLYIQYGKEYANFSIGPFQIKPSFTEEIEIDFLNSNPKHFLQDQDTVRSEYARSKRVERMKNKRKMAEYICLFLKVLESKYPTWKNEEEKVRFFASAYNCGYRKNRNTIESYASKRFFHTGFGVKKKYSYSDIAVYYFKHE